jgi:hypothetical protein
MNKKSLTLLFVTFTIFFAYSTAQALAETDKYFRALSNEEFKLFNTCSTNKCDNVGRYESPERKQCWEMCKREVIDLLDTVESPKAANLGVDVRIEQQGLIEAVVYRGEKKLQPGDGYVMQEGDVIIMPGTGGEDERLQDRIKIRFSNGGVVTLFPGSELKMGTKTFTARGKTLIFLNYGKIKIVDDNNSPLEIRTKTLIIYPEGTTYIASYDEEKNETKVAVLEGSVKVTPTNTALTPMTISANKETSVTEKEIRPASPLSEESKDLFEETTEKMAISPKIKMAAAVLGLLLAVFWFRRARKNS